MATCVPGCGWAGDGSCLGTYPHTRGPQKERMGGLWFTYGASSSSFSSSRLIPDPGVQLVLLDFSS